MSQAIVQDTSRVSAVWFSCGGVILMACSNNLGRSWPKRLKDCRHTHWCCKTNVWKHWWTLSPFWDLLQWFCCLNVTPELHLHSEVSSKCLYTNNANGIRPNTLEENELLPSNGASKESSPHLRRRVGQLGGAGWECGVVMGIIPHIQHQHKQCFQMLIYNWN